MPSIADLFVTVSSDVTGAISGLTAVDTRLSGTTTAMAGATAAAIPLAAAAAAVGAAFLTSIGEAASFEQQMNGIKAVMSPTEVQTFGTAVEDLALKLGRDTVFSSTQAAGAIEELIKAGVPLPDILSGAAAAALDLASATGTNVEQAAMFAATAMNTFHVSAAELPAIMDTISNVSNATAADVSGLQIAMSQAGVAAASVGLEFGETAIALGIFANNGLKGSDAGTALRTMLLNLQPTTKTQTEAFKELGLITEDGVNQFYDASGSAKSMREIFELLKTSTSGLTDQQRTLLLEMAFGPDAFRAANIAATEGAAGYDKATEAMDKMGGVAVSAAQRNAGLTGAMNQLGGAIEAVQITIGQLFLPILTQMVQGLTFLVNAFSSLDPTLQTFIVAAVGIAGAVAGIVAGMILLGPVLTAASAAFGILVAAAAPFLIPILAITAAVAALYLAWQTNFGGIRDVTAEVWAAIQPGLENIRNFLSELGAALGPALQQLGANLQPFMDKMSELAGGILGQLPGLIRATGDEFNNLGVLFGRISTLFQALVAAFTTDAGAMGIVVDMIREIFGDAVGDALDPFLNWFMNAIPTIKKFVDDVGATIGRVVTLFQALVAAFQTDAGAMGIVLDMIRQIFGDAVADALEPFIQWFMRAIPEIQAFARAVGDFFNGIPGLISAAGDIFGPIVNAAWALGQRVGEAFGNFLGFIGNALSGIPGMIAALGDFFGPFVNAAWQIGARLGEAFGNFLSFIRDRIASIPGMITGLGDLFGPVVTAAWNIGQGLGDAIANFWNFIRNAVSSIPGMIGEIDIFGGIIAAAWNIGQGLGEAVGNFVMFIRNSVAGVAGWVQENADWIFTAVIDAAWNIGQGLGEAVGNFVMFIRNSIVGIATWIQENAGGIFAALADAAWAAGGPIADAVMNFIGFIGGAIGGIPAMIANIPDIFGGIVEAAMGLAGRIGEAIEPIRTLLANTFGAFWDFLTGAIQLPTGGDTGGGGGTAPLPGGTSGPIVSIGTLVIASEAEAQEFLQLVAEAVLASARRVTAPVAGTNPALP
jgi:TP901 family phage tail tape measure protein